MQSIAKAHAMTSHPELSPCDLVDRYGRMLYAYAYRLTSSAADAEDIVQNVFLRAVKNCDRLAEASNLQAYLYAMVRNEAIRWRQSKFAANTTAELDEVQQMDNANEVDRDWLQTGLMKLPESSRRILLMFYFEDATYKEIAEALEVPIGTVMSRLSRAKQSLREELEQLESNESKDRNVS
jgi:RNA polymerase sigma-70 factor, ECF subfamily